MLFTGWQTIITLKRCFYFCLELLLTEKIGVLNVSSLFKHMSEIFFLNLELQIVSNNYFLIQFWMENVV